MTTLPPAGPDPAFITEWIRTSYPETDIFEMPGATFYSFDPQDHWPSYATIVTSDEFDTVADLARPGVFRLNLGVDRTTFDRLVGELAEPDYAALDRILPHPDYAAQHWIGILNPSWTTWNESLVSLIELAHDRLARVRARHVRPGV